MMDLKNYSDAELIERLIIYEARESFWVFYRFMNPNIKIGWWQKVICDELQHFYHEMLKGNRPKCVMQAPPQHGKSVLVMNFLAWISGKDPNMKTIFASFSERLGVRANIFLQRVHQSPRYLKVFPVQRIEILKSYNPAKKTRNREFLEYSDGDGYFRNTTVNGAVTGESLDFGLIDDPIKGGSEANSPLMRERVWEWFTGDFFSRFSEGAGLLIILTRWHVDDLVGRLIESKIGEKVKIISYPAIATRDEEFRKEGDALFPQLKSIGFLLERKALYSKAKFEALYQQKPQITGGDFIHTKDFGYYKVLPPIQYRVIIGDTSQKTEERHDYSVFQCWGRGEDRKAYLIDQIRGKWEAPELERRCVAFWNKHKSLDHRYHGVLRKAIIEDAASGTGLMQKIKKEALMPIKAVTRVKDKCSRVNDVIGSIESGYVMLPINAPFLSDFLDECEAFTKNDSHLHDDQVDCLVDAINEILDSVITTWESL